MPSLTLDTSPKESQRRSSQNTNNNSRSASPTQAPPFSPLTPTLAAARLAASSSSNQAHNAPSQQTHIYTHSQPEQVSIPQPPMIPIDFETNPDTLALKSAIAVLLNQKKTATNDIAILAKTKARALAEPEEFIDALLKGNIKMRGDPLFDPQPLDDDEDDENGLQEGEDKRMSGVESNPRKMPWDPIPKPQTVVRTPAINWSQYGIVGESLDKLHADQVARPNEGSPARIGTDGQVVFSGGQGIKRQDMGIAAPYAPLTDKLEKDVPKKGSKKRKTNE